MGANISMLVYGTRPLGAWVDWKKDLYAKPGDIMYIGNDNWTSHVLVVKSHTEDSLESCDYGQFFNGNHGGISKSRAVKYMLGGQFTGDVGHERKINGWVSIDKLKYTADSTIPDGAFKNLDNPYF
jgi:hypothetical protein